ncbi:hypothetical protein FB45DRAFT_838132 [Roridomyces roridus]|uniref:Indoleamine 2,3-dioxygenase n=1 Tax=Roridomyces roridus TaxID=1738132 RepID=A0AAD7BL19_9AGAR|nr:hypothetical protein FB45DRAFT_838132 [Roridomyces roridus]
MPKVLSWLLPSWTQPEPSLPSPSTQILDEPLQHDVLTRLRSLIVVGGGGSWPPRATYRETWPVALRSYDSVYRAMEPSFPVPESSVDNAYNRKIIDSFRSRMRSQLDTHVDMEQVRRAFEGAESCPQGVWLGLFLCLSFLRHSYRWGVSPIVSEAQSEQSLDIPEELELPWRYLQRHFGTASPGGCMTSLIYCNLREDDSLEYSVTVGLPEAHRSTEYWTTKLTSEMEVRALPVYHLFAQSIAHLDEGDASAACATLKSANETLRAAFKFFFSTMSEAHISREVWMAYAQGYQGWTLGGVDGSSGGQSVLFRTLDSFLGIRPFPTPEKESLHLPTAQRDWFNYLREYDIRAVVKACVEGEEGEALTAELDALVKQLRVWRMGHMHRMVRYESVHRPERQTMTAGISVVDSPSEDQMIEHLKRELGKRLAQTV